MLFEPNNLPQHHNLLSLLYRFIKLQITSESHTHTHISKKPFDTQHSSTQRLEPFTKQYHTDIFPRSTEFRIQTSFT